MRVTNNNGEKNPNSLSCLQECPGQRPASRFCLLLRRVLRPEFLVEPLAQKGLSPAVIDPAIEPGLPAVRPLRVHPLAMQETEL